MSIIVQTALTEQEKARIIVVLQRLVMALHALYIRPDIGECSADVDIPTAHLVLAYSGDAILFSDCLEVRRRGHATRICRAGTQYTSEYCHWGDDAYYALTYLSELEAAIAAAEAR